MSTPNYNCALRFISYLAAATLFLSAAEAVRTTTVIIDASPAENWACSAGRLWHCQEYMKDEAVRRDGAGAVIDGTITGLSRRQINFGMCCCKLKLMEAAAETGEGNIVCSGVEEAMRGLVEEQRQRGEVIMGDEELMNAWGIAEELPRKCGVVNSPAKCRFNSRMMIASSL